MLQGLIAFYGILLAASMAIAQIMVVTKNGIIPKLNLQKSACLEDINNLLGNNKENFNGILREHLHHVTIKLDGVEYLKGRLESVSVAIIFNFIYLFSFIRAAYIMASNCNLPLEEVITERMSIILFIGYFIGLATIVIGFISINRADNFEEFGRITMKKQIKKIRKKL